MQRTFGGDTLNTAVYLARCLRQSAAQPPATVHPAAVHHAAVHYVTALGDDPFSAEMLTTWQREGIETSLVARLPGRLPGLYIIRTEDAGRAEEHSGGKERGATCRSGGWPHN